MGTVYDYPMDGQREFNIIQFDETVEKWGLDFYCQTQINDGGANVNFIDIRVRMIVKDETLAALIEEEVPKEDYAKKRDSLIDQILNNLHGIASEYRQRTEAITASLEAALMGG